MRKREKEKESQKVQNIGGGKDREWKTYLVDLLHVRLHNVVIDELEIGVTNPVWSFAR